MRGEGAVVAQAAAEVGGLDDLRAKGTAPNIRWANCSAEGDADPATTSVLMTFPFAGYLRPDGRAV